MHRTALRELAAAFETPDDHGPSAYVAQLALDHPDVDEVEARADAAVAVTQFCMRVLAVM